jgi:hypothetical protein
MGVKTLRWRKTENRARFWPLDALRLGSCTVATLVSAAARGDQTKVWAPETELTPRSAHEYEPAVRPVSILLIILAATPVACRPTARGSVDSGVDAGETSLQSWEPTWARPESAEGIVRLAARPFDLQGSTISLAPESTGYRVSKQALRFQPPVAKTMLTDFTSWVGFGEVRCQRVALPFPFAFGGATWSEVFVSSTGSLTFGAPETELWKKRDPWAGGRMRSIAAAMDARAAAGLERSIAALWAIYDLGSEAASIETLPDQLVVTWDVERTTGDYAALGRNLFQARLSRDGTIELSYSAVAERDGIVGVFSGGSNAQRELDHISSPVDPSIAPEADIVGLTVLDRGSTLAFVFDLAGPRPPTTPSGQLMYRITLDFGSRHCQAWGDPENPTEATTSCTAAPGRVAVADRGSTLELIVSKLALDGASQFSWAAEAIRWSPTESFDDVNGMQPVMLASAEPSVDFSTASGVLLGNAFEVFHYPVLPFDVLDVLDVLYARHPRSDDFAIVYPDFRFDNLGAGGPSTGALNVPIKGIGPGLEQPTPTHFAVNTVQVATGPSFIGRLPIPSAAPDWVVPFDYDREATGVAHEWVHRWGIALRFRDPDTRAATALTDDWCHCHWHDNLNVPALAPVAAAYGQDYPEASIMGGANWRENPDGTFTRLDTPYMQPMGFSALDLYLIGLLSRDEVPETFLLRDLVQLDGGTWQGRKVAVRIADIIAVEGDRDPAAGQAQRKFTAGIYVLHLGTQPDVGMLARADIVGRELGLYFQRASGGRMTVEP